MIFAGNTSDFQRNFRKDLKITTYNAVLLPRDISEEKNKLVAYVISYKIISQLFANRPKKAVLYFPSKYFCSA